MRKACVALALTVALSQAVVAEEGKKAIGDASKATSVEGLNSIRYYGVAENGNLGPVSIHSLNPDRLTSVADMKASLGRQ